MALGIVQRIGSGDPSAVRECVQVYGARVWSLARRFTQTQADAEDAVQEIFMAIWKSAHRFDPSQSEEGTFITMIARRRLIDGLRRAAVDTEALVQWPDLHSLDPTNSPNSPNSVERSAEAASIAELLKTFESPQREVITMAVYGGYSHSAIAHHLSLPLGTAKTLLRRGLDDVRRVLRLAREELL